MARVLKDSEISELLTEHKPLPKNWELRLEPRPVPNLSYKKRDFDIQGEQGHKFRIIVRENIINPLDFSIILIFIDDDSVEYRIRRFNGKHPSSHTNRLEKMEGKSNSSFRNMFHIHTATQRYQDEGLKIDGYAEVTKEYSSIGTALDAFIRMNGFLLLNQEPSLFDVEGDSK